MGSVVLLGYMDGYTVARGRRIVGRGSGRGSGGVGRVVVGSKSIGYVGSIRNS